MKRRVDKPYHAYSVLTALSSELNVKCPVCQGFARVTADSHTFFFRCTECGHTKEKSRTIYRYDVHNQCNGCGRYYRVEIPETKKQHFSSLSVACPYCGTVMSGKVHKTAKSYFYLGEIKHGQEPFFGLELWFLSSFQNKLIWALNREHLAYLMDYLSADLREKPAPFRMTKTQSDHLPAFIKTAKNRERIVKLLKKMQM